MKITAVFIRLTRRCHTPHTKRPLDKGDVLWLRWVVLSVSVLFCMAALMASGCTGGMNDWHTALLQGAPLHLPATGANAGSVLSPATTFACCIPLTLYWAAVMMHQKNLRHRTELTAMLLVALALPGILCVLWDSVLHTLPLLCCVLITWLLVICIPFFGKTNS